MKSIAVNKRASFDYEIEKTFEAWIILLGYEVKAVKTQHLNLSDAIAHFEWKELRIKNLDIPLYLKTSPLLIPNYQSKRKRKLLHNFSELWKISWYLDKPWYLVLPLQTLVAKNGRIKIILWVWKRKKNIQKKQILKEHDIERQMNREIKSFKF